MTVSEAEALIISESRGGASMEELRSLVARLVAEMAPEDYERLTTEAFPAFGQLVARMKEA